jgi:hypothetical protein
MAGGEGEEAGQAVSSPRAAIPNSGSPSRTPSQATAQWRLARSSPIPLRVSPGVSPGSLANFPSWSPTRCGWYAAGDVGHPHRELAIVVHSMEDAGRSP